MWWRRQELHLLNLMVPLSDLFWNHPHKWHQPKDSNPDSQFWRLLCYHYTKLIRDSRCELLDSCHIPILFFYILGKSYVLEGAPLLYSLCMVRPTGIEPARHCCQRILSPLRLPIPPRSLNNGRKSCRFRSTSCYGKLSNALNKRRPTQPLSVTTYRSHLIRNQCECDCAHAYM